MVVAVGANWTTAGGTVTVVVVVRTAIDVQHGGGSCCQWVFIIPVSGESKRRR